MLVQIPVHSYYIPTQVRRAVWRVTTMKVQEKVVTLNWKWVRMKTNFFLFVTGLFPQSIKSLYIKHFQQPYMKSCTIPHGSRYSEKKQSIKISSIRLIFKDLVIFLRAQKCFPMNSMGMYLLVAARNLMQPWIFFVL